ncbi:MAG: L-histidine N(alpha)-methyltransferase [Candidatus Aminicenantes bacterium]|jgi:dimethylhistidine N-methyltransferase
MGATYRILTHDELDPAEKQEQAFSTDVLIGLSKTSKGLPSKYFYDERGSRLFQKIMDLPEYYLTNSEFEILETKKDEISRLVEGERFNLVELGPGDGRKTSLLLQHFLQKRLEFEYIPIDICEASMLSLTKSLNETFPELEARGVVAEYFEGLKWMNETSRRRNMVLFLGSNLGNFDRVHSRAFLHNMWNSLNNGDYVVIGFDLKKDIDLMLKAYNDSQGITAEFNMNLLSRINRELGGNFNLQKFRFYSSYDVFTGAMESYLVSLEKQEVFIEQIGLSFTFDAWEPIHTEYSYKYLESDIAGLAEATGFVIEQQLYDSRNYFVDSVWQVQKKEASS